MNNPKPIDGIKQYEPNVFCWVRIILLWRREQDLNLRRLLTSHAFQACALNRSTISPKYICFHRPNRITKNHNLVNTLCTKKCLSSTADRNSRRFVAVEASRNNANDIPHNRRFVLFCVMQSYFNVHAVDVVHCRVFTLAKRLRLCAFHYVRKGAGAEFGRVSP